MGPQGPGHPGGVDLYVGGVEHAVLHLLYARFWHKVLYDLGHVSSREPYRRLVNQGYIQAFAYTDARGTYVPAADVIERDGGFCLPGPDGETEVFQEFGKIGKSLKNMVSPDEMYAAFGADTFRLYEMGLGPLEPLLKDESINDILINTHQHFDHAAGLAAHAERAGLAHVAGAQPAVELPRPSGLASLAPDVADGREAIRDRERNHRGDLPVQPLHV